LPPKSNQLHIGQDLAYLSLKISAKSARDYVCNDCCWMAGRQDAVYSLPQPYCYGDDTLRAVKLITEKYDTFKRRQMRAMSFRDTVAAGVVAKVTTRQHDSDTIAEGWFC